MSYYQSPPLKGLCVPGSLKVRFPDSSINMTWKCVRNAHVSGPNADLPSWKSCWAVGKHVRYASENSSTWFWPTGKPEAPCILQERKPGCREVRGLAPSFPDDRDEIKRKAACLLNLKVWLRVKTPQFGQPQTFPWADNANEGTCLPCPSAIMPMTLTTCKTLPQSSPEPPSLVGISLSWKRLWIQSP